MRPPKNVLEAFGVSSSPNPLPGGQGQNYRAGSIVLKPVTNAAEARWVAEVYRDLPPSNFRLPRPVSTSSGEWIIEGWSAQEFVTGETAEGGHYEARFQACRDFHRALESIPQPDFLAERQDPWSQADRIVWEGEPWHPHPQLADIYQRLMDYAEPLELPQQLIHGDIAGNMLYAPGQPLAIIDFSPYWRPAIYAEALLFVDAVMWEGAPWSILELMSPDDVTTQVILRAAMRRLAEVNQHYLTGKKPETYLSQSRHYWAFLNRMETYIL